jgi:hypothetical protein
MVCILEDEDEHEHEDENFMFPIVLVLVLVLGCYPNMPFYRKGGLQRSLWGIPVPLQKPVASGQ